MLLIIQTNKTTLHPVQECVMLCHQEYLAWSNLCGVHHMLILVVDEVNRVENFHIQFLHT